MCGRWTDIRYSIIMLKKVLFRLPYLNTKLSYKTNYSKVSWTMSKPTRERTSEIASSERSHHPPPPPPWIYCNIMWGIACPPWNSLSIPVLPSTPTNKSGMEAMRTISGSSCKVSLLTKQFTGMHESRWEPCEENTSKEYVSVLLVVGAVFSVWKNQIWDLLTECFQETHSIPKTANMIFYHPFLDHSFVPSVCKLWFLSDVGYFIS